MTLAETIRETTRKHLMENNGVLMSQCVKAVGWIGATVPEIYDDDKIIELPTSDVSNGAIAVGFGLVGKRVIYVIRYAGFMHYNAISLINYAAKSKEMWDVPCPIFIRCLTMEGSIGPVASGSYLSPIIRMPGIPVFAPMTPKEWLNCWNYYLNHGDPVLCSEHRLSFSIDEEMDNEITDDANITILAISAARLNAMKSIEILEKEGIKCNLFHLWRLKPFKIPNDVYEMLKSSGLGLVIDSDYELCGASQMIANDLMLKTRVPVHAMGLEDRTAGFAKHCDNRTPSPKRIVKFIKKLLNEA